MQKWARSTAPQGTRLHTYLHWLQQQHAGGGQHASFIQSTLSLDTTYTTVYIVSTLVNCLTNPCLQNPNVLVFLDLKVSLPASKLYWKEQIRESPSFSSMPILTSLNNFNIMTKKKQRGMKSTQDISWNTNPQRAIICTTCKTSLVLVFAFLTLGTLGIRCLRTCSKSSTWKWKMEKIIYWVILATFIIRKYKPNKIVIHVNLLMSKWTKPALLAVLLREVKYYMKSKRHWQTFHICF